MKINFDVFFKCQHLFSISFSMLRCPRVSLNARRRTTLKTCFPTYLRKSCLRYVSLPLFTSSFLSIYGYLSLFLARSLSLSLFTLSRFCLYCSRSFYISLSFLPFFFSLLSSSFYKTCLCLGEGKGEENGGRCQLIQLKSTEIKQSIDHVIYLSILLDQIVMLRGRIFGL